MEARPGAARAAGLGTVWDPCSALRSPTDGGCPVQAGLKFPVFPFHAAPGFAIVSPSPRSKAGKADGAGPGEAGPGDGFTLLERLRSSKTHGFSCGFLDSFQEGERSKKHSPKYLGVGNSEAYLFASHG